MNKVQHTAVLQPGAREPGGGKGGQLPPNFLSQWDGYACAPPKIWQSLGISTPPPPQEKNRSRAPDCSCCVTSHMCQRVNNLIQVTARALHLLFWLFICGGPLKDT